MRWEPIAPDLGFIEPDFVDPDFIVSDFFMAPDFPDPLMSSVPVPANATRRYQT